ncbi:hypothetical protein [Mucilaginibacter phyllosphaerae]
MITPKVELTKKRIFITCASGFLLRHIINIIDINNTHITLLYLAKSEREAEIYFKNLLIHLGIKASNNFTLLTGNLLKENWGIDDLKKINSDYWLCGTLPFDFGVVKMDSAIAANNLSQMLLNVYEKYNKTVEPVKHIVVLSSVFTIDYKTLILKEEFNKSKIHFGNFDFCKSIIENKISNFISMDPFNKITIIRVDVGLSSNSNQVGGIFNSICKIISMPALNNLCLKSNILLRFTDIHKLNLLFYNTLLNGGNSKFNIINAIDHEQNVNIGEFIKILGDYSSKKINITENEDISSPILSASEKKINTILQSTFGFYLLEKYNNVNILNTNTQISRNTELLKSTHQSKIEILKKVVSNSINNKFRINNLDLGPMPIL